MMQSILNPDLADLEQFAPKTDKAAEDAIYASLTIPASTSILPGNDGVITINLVAGVTDYAPLINAALHTEGVIEVRLGAGTFPVSSPIYLPSGAHLTGAGAEATILQASPGFIGSSPVAVVLSEYRASDITLSDFAVDGSKLSPDGLRLNGVFMDEVVGFDISRVDVHNVTGYAHFARGDVNSLVAGVPSAVGTSGSYIDCNSYNAQVHFEVMFGDGVSYTNCSAADGDGDISTEAYFHPLLGSRNISYTGCTAIGDGLIGFSLISAYRSMENISITDCYVEINREASGYGLLDSSGLATLNLQIVNSTFISRDYIGFSAVGITGSAIGSTFQGGVIGVNIENLGDGTAPDFDIIDSYLLAVQDPNNLAGIVGIQAVAGVTATGGIVEARGSGGLMFPASGTLAVSPTTALVDDGFDSRTAYKSANGATLLFPLFALPTATFGSFANGSIAITFQNHSGASDSIVLLGSAAGGAVELTGNQVRFGGVVIGTVLANAGDAGLTISLTSAASTASVGALLRSIAYSSGGQNPGTETRLVEVVITDGVGASADFTAAIHMGTVQGGLADDLYIVHNHGTIIQESEGYGIDEVRTALTGYVLPVHVENLTLIGNGAATLQGNALNNVITGGNGNDTLYGGVGADRLQGGNGDDVYYVDSNDSIVEVADNGFDSVYTSTNFALEAGVSIELLSAINDSLAAAINLSGNETKNRVIGNDSANILSGGGAKDKIIGLGGDDILIGGEHFDRLTGGDGADTFLYEALSDSTAQLPDWITDFSADDIIDLSAVDANTAVEGNQAFSFISSNAFGMIAGELRAFEHTSGLWMVEGDVDGDGVADFAIQVTLSGLANISAADFIL